MSKKIKIYCLTLLVSISINSFAVKITDIAQLVNKRLSYMKDVSFFKYHHSILVEDIARETVVLSWIKKAITKYHLNEKQMVFLFELQMIAAKEIQYRYIDNFRCLGKPDNLIPADSKKLFSQIRPILEKITQDIIDTISEYIKEGKTFSEDQYAEFSKQITVEHLPLHAKKNIFYALIKITKNS